MNDCRPSLRRTEVVEPVVYQPHGRFKHASQGGLEYEKNAGISSTWFCVASYRVYPILMSSLTAMLRL